jgi:hypothetical protein
MTPSVNENRNIGSERFHGNIITLLYATAFIKPVLQKARDLKQYLLLLRV